MVSIFFFFWLLVVLFGVIGAMRGWAKEILVSFSVILALFMKIMFQLLRLLCKAQTPERKHIYS